jgi:threonine/homoserine/homoserine lactone efflux protein
MLAFVLTAILIELTPGPNMTWLAVLGATRGKQAAMAAVAGICLGLGFAGIIAGIGLSTILTSYPPLLTVLRWAGTLYLFYLAYDAWQDSEHDHLDADQPSSVYFVQGLVSNALNPKAYLFYAAILPQFFDPAHNVMTDVIYLTTVYVAVATVIHTVIALLSGSIAGWLASSPHAKTTRRALAVAIAIAAVWFFISTQNLTSGILS